MIFAMKWAYFVNICQELAAYLKHRTEEGRKAAEEAAVRPAGNSHGRTLILAPRACKEHRTAPEPLTRDAWGHMPPENVCRLHVLTDPGSRQAHLSPSIDCFWKITDLVLHAVQQDPLKSFTCFHGKDPWKRSCKKATALVPRTRITNKACPDGCRGGHPPHS